MRNLIVWTASLFVLASIVAGQTPVLVDEFDKPHCDEFLARVDNFFLQLNAEPTATGYFILSGPENKRLEMLEMDMLFDGAIAQRAYEAALVKKAIAWNLNSNEIHLQFWLVQSGSAPPEVEVVRRIEWHYNLSPGMEPFILHTDNEHICSTPTFPKVYQAILLANPKAHGNVVIYGNSRKAQREGLKDAKETLKAIPKARFRYFFVRSADEYPWADYWIVPPKVKRPKR